VEKRATAAAARRAPAAKHHLRVRKAPGAGATSRPALFACAPTATRARRWR
jgi:hypothetical protein